MARWPASATSSRGSRPSSTRKPSPSVPAMAAQVRSGAESPRPRSIWLTRDWSSPTRAPSAAWVRCRRWRAARTSAPSRRAIARDRPSAATSASVRRGRRRAAWPDGGNGMRGTACTTASLTGPAQLRHIGGVSQALGLVRGAGLPGRRPVGCRTTAGVAGRRRRVMSTGRSSWRVACVRRGVLPVSRDSGTSSWAQNWLSYPPRLPAHAGPPLRHGRGPRRPVDGRPAAGASVRDRHPAREPAQDRRNLVGTDGGRHDRPRDPRNMTLVHRATTAGTGRAGRGQGGARAGRGAGRAGRGRRQPPPPGPQPIVATGSMPSSRRNASLDGSRPRNACSSSAASRAPLGSRISRR